MRVKIEIPDRLHDELARIASDRRTTVASVVVDLLRTELHARSAEQRLSPGLGLRTVSFGKGLIRSDHVKAADEEW